MPKTIHLLLAVCLLSACKGDRAESAKEETGQKDADSGDKTDKADEATDDLGHFTDKGVVDLSKLANKTPAEVDALLGAPSESAKGKQISCVRFVPKRVFFACVHELRRYDHSDLEYIQVDFEDGHAATISLVGLPGVGEFDHLKALEIAGLDLPGAPRKSSPPFGVQPDVENVVDLWDWGNSSARLLVDDQQFRVRTSVVQGVWNRSKLEIINNSPLSDDQKTRVREPKNKAAGAPSEEAHAPAEENAPAEAPPPRRRPE